ncbi:MAG: hypothetical protein JO247_08425 [Chloroflexi bacterium]|nr:hypothetical protein [Chloroflexota bacterium]
MLIVGTEHGLTVLHEDGAWRPAAMALGGWEVTDLLAAPGGELLAATRGDGMWRSDDRGQTWRKPSYGKPGPGKVHTLCLDGTGHLYAGCEPIDLFISDDLGESWRLVDSVRSHPWVAEVTYPNKKVEPHLRDLAISPKGIYAALQVGYMLMSGDGGSTWELLDKEVDGDVHVIAIHPDRPHEIVIATGGDGARRGTSPGRALYRSEDAGATWQPVAMDFRQTYSAPLAAQPGKPDVLVSSVAIGNSSRWKPPEMADSAVIRSSDGGRSWQQLSDGLAQTSTGFAETLAFDPVQPERLFAGFRNGDVYGSDDGGGSWRQLSVEGELGSITALLVVE